MAKVSINTIKNWFKNGLKPTQEQFWAWMDSYWHKDEKLPIETVDGLDEIIANKADTEQLTNHVNDNTAHGIPELKKELETGIAEKADTKQLTNHINDNDAHGIPGLKKALETLIATKTDKGGYDGTSKDLKDEIDANKKAFDAYTPPEYNIDLAANQLTLLKDGAKVSELDLSMYLDDTNLARLVSGTLNAETGVLTVTRDDDTTFDIDLSTLVGGISTDTDNSLTLGNDEKPFFKQRSAAEVKTAYESNANTNAFTDSEKTKLAGLEGSKFKGTYGSLSALQSALPKADEGSYAYVDSGTGSSVHQYVWDNNDSRWQNIGEAGADSPAIIKSKYESNTDTNAFTDTYKKSLDGLQSALDTKENAFTKKTAFNKNFGTAADTVLEGNWRPSWDDIASKPTTFTPIAHNHDDRYYTESESDERFTKHNASETIGGAWDFTNTELTLSAHLYRRVYDDNNVYDHYYPGLGNGSSYTKAHLRVWNGAGGAKVLNFDGLGNISWDGNKIWHSGNHGAGSGLDADKLDGRDINNVITYNNTINNYGDYVQFTQKDQDSELNPSSDWYTTIKMLHQNSSGYYTQIAFPFHSEDLKWRRFQSGSDQGWRTIWHSGNFNPSDYLPLTGGAVKGTLSIDFGYTNKIRMYLEQGTANIADTFADTSTDKSYIYFDYGYHSNDPGYIMHETSDSETNEGVLHLCPTDDNNYGDYVSIHGTNDPDAIKLHTDGYIETIGSIKASGNVTANSDKRLKKNIKSIPNALEKVLQLNGCTWDRNDISLSQAGVIAQELQEVLPVAVSEGDNGMLSVDVSNALPALLIEAIKELKIIIDGITK